MAIECSDGISVSYSDIDDIPDGISVRFSDIDDIPDGISVRFSDTDDIPDIISVRFSDIDGPHDPDLTINVLLQVVLSHFQNLKQLSRPLPKRLCLQLDNTARENKNRCVLSFLSLLVQLEVFEEVELGFLMVGHTHEDIDALFGNIGKWLKNNNALTVPDQTPA
eukprot:Em0002g561a